MSNIKILNTGVKHQFNDCAATKLSDVASNGLAVFDLDAVFGEVASVFGSLSADCSKASFQDIGLTNDGIYAPPTPYPSTLFPVVQRSNIDDDLEENCVDLPFKG